MLSSFSPAVLTFATPLTGSCDGEGRQWLSEGPYPAGYCIINEDNPGKDPYCGVAKSQTACESSLWLGSDGEYYPCNFDPYSKACTLVRCGPKDGQAACADVQKQSQNWNPNARPFYTQPMVCCTPMTGDDRTPTAGSFCIRDPSTDGPTTYGQCSTEFYDDWCNENCPGWKYGTGPGRSNCYMNPSMHPDSTNIVPKCKGD